VAVTRSETVDVRVDSDVVRVRQVVREWAIREGFGLVDQTKIVTAASELARNMIRYAQHGTTTLEVVEEGGRRGLRLTFADQGPGIPDIERALRDGFTTGDGLGLGLGGARRLMSDFSIESTVGQGTRVVVARWR
jgi:serine/threonine-protein kinase RsbT